MRRVVILACAAVVALGLFVGAASGRGEHLFRRATVYSTSDCDATSGGYLTADGTDLRSWRRGVIASNALPMHTLIRFDRPLFGRRYYRVRDTGGGGSSLFDVFVPCSRLPADWPNPVLGFRVVRWGAR